MMNTHERRYEIYPSHKEHFIATIKIEGFKPKVCNKKEDEPLKDTHIKYDEKNILTLLDSLDDEVVDMFLEGISFAASSKQTFSYSLDNNMRLIHAIVWHIGFSAHPMLSRDALCDLFKNILSTNENVDKINKLIKLLSN